MKDLIKAIKFVFWFIVFPVIVIIYYIAHEGNISGRPKWLRAYFLATQFIPLVAISILLTIQTFLNNSGIKNKLISNATKLIVILFITSFLIEIIIYRFDLFGL